MHYKDCIGCECCLDSEGRHLEGDIYEVCLLLCFGIACSHCRDLVQATILIAKLKIFFSCVWPVGWTKFFIQLICMELRNNNTSQCCIWGLHKREPTALNANGQ